MRKVVSVALAVVATAALWVTPALADGPGVGTPTVVSVGDSAISGEAGRGRAIPTARRATSTRSARPRTTTPAAQRRSTATYSSPQAWRRQLSSASWPQYNAGAPRGGTCSRTTTGLNAQGEPNMSFG